MAALAFGLQVRPPWGPTFARAVPACAQSPGPACRASSRAWPPISAHRRRPACPDRRARARRAEPRSPAARDLRWVAVRPPPSRAPWCGTRRASSIARADFWISESPSTAARFFLNVAFSSSALDAFVAQAHSPSHLGFGLEARDAAVWFRSPAAAAWSRNGPGSATRTRVAAFAHTRARPRPHPHRRARPSAVPRARRDERLELGELEDGGRARARGWGGA